MSAKELLDATVPAQEPELWALNEACNVLGACAQ